MKQKIICAAAAASLAAAVCSNAFADTYEMNPAVLKENEITISGRVIDGSSNGIGNRPVTLEVIKPGGLRTNIDDIFYLGETVTSAGVSAGEYKFVLQLEDGDEGGIYKVYLKGRGIDGADQEFVYISMSSRSELIEELKACADRETAAALFGDENTKVILNGMGVSNDRFEAMPEKSKEAVYDFLLSDNYTAENFTDKILEVFAVCELNSAFDEREDGTLPDALAVLESNAGVIGIDTGENSLWNWLGKLNSEVAEKILKGKEYKNTGDVYSAYMEAGIVKAFSNAAYNQMEELTKICGEYLKLDLTYGGNENRKSAVLKKMVGVYESSEEICKRFNDALKEAQKPADTGSGSSGGSGGSGRKNYTVSVPVDKKNEEDNDKTETGIYSAPEFNDLDEAAWAAEQIKVLAEKKVVDGDESGNFRPNDKMTREEFVKISVAAFGLFVEGSESRFTDVDNSKWYAPYVASANAAGMVQGKDDGSFGIGEFISRQDAAVMIDRILSAKKIEVEKVRKADKFTDYAEISVYAQKGIENLFCAGIINGMGDGTFLPGAPITRAQASVMIASVLDKISQIKA